MISSLLGSNVIVYKLFHNDTPCEVMLSGQHRKSLKISLPHYSRGRMFCQIRSLLVVAYF